MEIKINTFVSAITIYHRRNVTSVFSTILIFIAVISTNAQSSGNTAPTACLRAVYQLDYKLDSAIATPKRVRMILRSSNGISRFQSTGMHLLNSVYTSLAAATRQERIQQSLDATRNGGKNEFRYTVIKEPAKNLLSYHDIINSEDSQYQETLPLYAWQLTSLKKTIAGHECQQAYTSFGGRRWEAWFARDIPVSDGPYKFCGLPGLILQVQDTQNHYVFSLLCLDLNPHPFDTTVDSGAPLAATSSAPIISKTKFVQSKYNDDLTLLDRMAAVGNQVPESLRQNHLQMIKRRNNPLERK